MTENATTSGVQELIDRLSQDGVVEGQRQADTIIGESQRKADDILDAARQQANDILNQAREESKQVQAAGEEALKLACRDAVRDLGARIHDGFRNRLQELVQHQLKDPKVIKRMILEVTRAATDKIDDEQVEILLPPDLIQEVEVRQRIAAGDRDPLTELVQGLTGDKLRDGFTVNLGGRKGAGMTVRVVNQNVEIDLTEDAITELLARHLLPRFRAIMRTT